MFGTVIDIMKLSIGKVIEWTVNIFDATGGLPFVIFFVLLNAFLIRVLPQLVNRSGSDPVTKSTEGKPKHFLQSLDSPEKSTAIVVKK